MTLRHRIEKLEHHQGTKEDDVHIVGGSLGRLEINTIDDWLIMKEIVDEVYQKTKTGEIEDNEQTDEILCARIQKAISQSKQISAPGELLAMA